MNGPGMRGSIGSRIDRFDRGDVGLNANEEQKESNNRLMPVSVDDEEANIQAQMTGERANDRYNAGGMHRQSPLMNEVRDERRSDSNREEDLIQFERNQHSGSPSSHNYQNIPITNDQPNNIFDD